MLRSAKLAPVFPYDVLEAFWKDADALGYHGVWDYDHFYGLTDLDAPTLEGWTALAAMAAHTERSRVGCMVTGVTYRHPAVLANMAVTVDHISGGRLEMGLGAAWHEPEHDAYGIDFPSAGTRIAMLDEACELIRRLWTEDVVDHQGRFWTLVGAKCIPKPVQDRIPIVIGGNGRQKTLWVVAKHADEWNALSPGLSPEAYRELNGVLDEHCRAVGRDPADIRRSVQLMIHFGKRHEPEEVNDMIAGYAEVGMQHAVLSFYEPPTRDELESFAP